MSEESEMKVGSKVSFRVGRGTFTGRIASKLDNGKFEVITGEGKSYVRGGDKLSKA